MPQVVDERKLDQGAKRLASDLDLPPSPIFGEALASLLEEAIEEGIIKLRP